MEKIILTDCDGVLVYWLEGLEKFMQSKGHLPKPNSENEYNLAPRYGMTFCQITDLVSEFNQSELIENLNPFMDSIEYVNKLANHGFKFIVITSLGNSDNAKFYRERNLKKLFGDIFSEIICLPMNSSKEHVLKRWEGSNYFWIEDHMRQAEAGYEAGLRPILINHPYNSHYTTDLFPRVSFETPWKEIYNIVSLEYNL